MRALPATQVAALRQLLEDYDRANRLEIDAVYAQLSPTLDDFYVEELRLTFPDYPAGAESRPAEVRPDIVLTRDVAGLAHRRATATGAPFPLATAGRLAREALREAGGAETHALLAELESGQSWLAPQQVARSQTVRLVVQPAGQDLLDRLAVLLSLA